MADPFQVELLRKGPEAWNAWRKAADAPVDLRGANFGDIKLPKIDLRTASLKGARLRWAYLREADTIASKVVLILGRFTYERKAVLDALREELRKRDYLPVLFDFEKPRSRDTDETITLLARMAKFVIADISDAKSVLQELRAIVPNLPSVPVQPIILAIQEDPGMFDFYRNMSWFLAVYRYADQGQLLADLCDKIIRPAELKVLELGPQRSSIS